MTNTSKLNLTLKRTTTCALTLMASQGITYAGIDAAVKHPAIGCNDIAQSAAGFTGLDLTATLDTATSPMKATEPKGPMLRYTPPAGLNCKLSVSVVASAPSPGFSATSVVEKVASTTQYYWVPPPPASGIATPTGSPVMLGTIRRMGPRPAANIVKVKKGAVYHIDPVLFNPSSADQTIVTNTFTIADGED